MLLFCTYLIFQAFIIIIIIIIIFLFVWLFLETLATLLVYSGKFHAEI